MTRSRRPSSPSVALILARYELVRELRGESDIVDWKAIDTALDREVVVQLLRPELVDDAAATERFWQVARAAARRTASVGERVLDAGTDPETGQIFVVRELVASSAAAVDGRRTTPREPAVMAQLLSRVSRVNRGPRWLVLSGVMVMLILVSAVIRPGVEGWLAWVNEPFGGRDRGLGLAPAVAAVPASGAQRSQSASTPAAAPPTVAAAGRAATPAPTSATAVPTRAATASPASTGQSRKIVNTDGRGVALRTSPGGDRQPGKGYDEGATVQALEQSGEWTHIQGSDGREGWVLSVTLAP
jgi:hypothetical protein